jgi:uncharacterized membrane protein
MPSIDTEHAIIATFDSQAQAEQAANDLADWDRTSPQIALGTIGVVTRDARGQIKTRGHGRNTAKGAKIGLGLGVLAAVLSGGLTLIPTAIAGAVVGTAAGSLSRKGLGLTDAEAQQLRSELDGGRAAVLVMCSGSDAKAITDYLTLEGARIMTHSVDPAALEAASKAVESTTVEHAPDQPPIS